MNPDWVQTLLACMIPGLGVQGPAVVRGEMQPITQRRPYRPPCEKDGELPRTMAKEPMQPMSARRPPGEPRLTQPISLMFLIVH